MTIDDITYGNPTIEQLPYLSKKTFVDELFVELSKYTFPKNSSDATKEELNQIVDYTQSLKGKNEFLDRYRAYDRGLISYFERGLTQSGDDFETLKILINDVIQDTLPLLTKLKYHFQRPRPYQLAEYYKLKLFPYKTFSGDSPSFPSGHAYQSKILIEVIGNRYPQIYSYLQSLFDDISYSRIYMGVHYQSDIDVAIFCAEKVLAMNEFKVKYKL